MLPGLFDVKSLVLSNSPDDEQTYTFIKVSETPKATQEYSLRTNSLGVVANDPIVFTFSNCQRIPTWYARNLETLSQAGSKAGGVKSRKSARRPLLRSWALQVSPALHSTWNNISFGTRVTPYPRKICGSLPPSSQSIKLCLTVRAGLSGSGKPQQGCSDREQKRVVIQKNGACLFPG